MKFGSTHLIESTADTPVKDACVVSKIKEEDILRL